MEGRCSPAETAVSLQSLLGYLNFSEGRPDPRFQKQINDLYQSVVACGEDKPWQGMRRALADKLEELCRADNPAFRDVTQAEAVLTLAFDKALLAYRRHHADLLFHQSDPELFQQFFVARVCEAVLAQGPPWDEEERIVGGALNKVNDFVGHRPIAILETRPRGESYDHERVRPIPLFIKGAGVAFGRYHELLSQALEVLAAADAEIRAEACFDLDLLDELAVDPRTYDFGHPVNDRPNYLFGE